MGHKELTCWKGPCSNRLCLNCRNVKNSDHLAPGEVNLKCWDSTKSVEHAAGDIFYVVDSLNTAKDQVSKTKLEQFETKYGFKCDDRGLMGSHRFRAFYEPVRHHLRDWMHMLASDGICNAELCAVAHALKESMGINRTRIQEFSLLCKLPKSRGKVHKSWFDEGRYRSYTMVSFASYILAMVPIMHLFLKEVNAAAVVPDVVDCFECLYIILGLFNYLGPHAIFDKRQILRHYIEKCHRLAVNLHGDYVLKPKLHHLHHIAESHVVLSCFTAERKHRNVKKLALMTFRHFEHTITNDALNEQCSHMVDCADIFAEQLLHTKRSYTIAGCGDISTSAVAVTRHGELHNDDIVYLTSGKAGRIQAFWQRNQEIIVELLAFGCIGGDTELRDERITERVFVDVRDIVSTCIWYQVAPSILRICLPPASLV